jgi:CheY-like chemotaxis protein
MNPRSLLIVDGDARTRNMLEHSLSREGHFVTSVGSAEEALEALQVAAPPDVLLSETLLPQMDGITLCQQLKEDQRWCGIQFVFLTSQRFLKTTLEQLGLDHAGFLTKPIYIDKLKLFLGELDARDQSPEPEPEPEPESLAERLAEPGPGPEPPRHPAHPPRVGPAGNRSLAMVAAAAGLALALGAGMALLKVAEGSSGRGTAASPSPALPAASHKAPRPAAAPREAPAPGTPTRTVWPSQFEAYAMLLARVRDARGATRDWERLPPSARRKVRRLLTRAVETNPRGWEALQQLALIELQRGTLDRALQLAIRAAQAQPDAPYAHLVIGTVLQEKRMRLGARAAYRRYLAVCPRCRHAREVRAVLHSL